MCCGKMSFSSLWLSRQNHPLLRHVTHIRKYHTRANTHSCSQSKTEDSQFEERRAVMHRCFLWEMIPNAHTRQCHHCQQHTMYSCTASDSKQPEDLMYSVCLISAANSPVLSDQCNLRFTYQFHDVVASITFHSWFGFVIVVSNLFRSLTC